MDRQRFSNVLNYRSVTSLRWTNVRFFSCGTAAVARHHFIWTASKDGLKMGSLEHRSSCPMNVFRKRTVSGPGKVYLLSVRVRLQVWTFCSALDVATNTGCRTPLLDTIVIVGKLPIRLRILGFLLIAVAKFVGKRWRVVANIGECEGILVKRARWGHSEISSRRGTCTFDTWRILVCSKEITDFFFCA